MNDGQSARAAALDLHDGIVLVAGTGSIGIGVRGAREERCGGWGYQVGDEGSGWWIGRRLLASFSRESDGRAPRSAVHDVVMRELGLSKEYDIVGYAREVLAGDRTKTASLARLAAEAARLGDPEALGIYHDAASELAQLARVLVDRMFADVSEPVRTTYVGGVFRVGDVVLEPLCQALPERCQLVPPAREPDVGAVLLLRRSLGREVG